MKKITQRIFRQLLVFGIVFFGSINLTSAQGWDKIFPGPDGERCHRVVSTSDGHIVASLTTLDGAGFPNIQQYGLIKMDTLGNTIWLKPIPHLPNVMTATNDGGVAFGNLGTNVNVNENVRFSKVDIDGDLEWTHFYPALNTTDTLAILDIFQTADNKFVFSGFRRNNGSTQFLGKLEDYGALIWLQDYNIPGFAEHLTETSQQEIIIAGQKPDFSSTPTLIKTDASGNIIWDKEYPDEGISINVTERTNGEIILVTSKSIQKLDGQGNVTSSTPITLSFPVNANLTADVLDNGFIFSSVATFPPLSDFGLVMYRYDDDGNQIWSRGYNYHSGNDVSFDVAGTADGGFVTVGYISTSTQWDAYILKSDENGIVYGNEFKGIVKWDENFDCNIDQDEEPLKNWIITASRPGHVFTTLTDENGEYFLPVDTGGFELTLFPPNNYWSLCQNNFSFDYTSLFNTDTVDFAVQSVIDCPYLEVNSNIPALRPCFDNSPYHVNWCNKGTTVAENSYLEIILDSTITPISSTLPWNTQNGDTLIFDLGNILPGECGNFDMFLMLDCDAPVGAAYCVETHIYPDSICTPISLPWNGAYIEVSGNCQDSTVSFQIENSGQGDMTQDGNYIIVEDAVLLTWNNFNLISEQITPLSFPANGSTYFLMATQEPNAPGNPTPIASLEGCGVNGLGDFSIGFLNQYPLGDNDPFVDLDCPIATAAYDPNDKQGFPIGYEEEHFIEPNTDIEYLIRFQNTGTDTAFNVVLRDTLDASLDISTLRQGAGSHAYELKIFGENILEFRFANIMLPDSNVNEAASHGAVEFKISQRTDLPLGTVIKNKAAIYFDYNLPIITNETYHTLGLNFITVSLQNPITEENRILVRPNPMQDFAIFELEKFIKDGQFELYDLSGKLAWQQKFSGNQFELKRNEKLTAGIYFYKISEEGNMINSGKIIVN